MQTENQLFTLSFVADTLGYSRQKLEDSVRKRKLPIQGKVMHGSKSVRVLAIKDVILFYKLAPTEIWFGVFQARINRERHHGTLDAAQKMLTEGGLKWTE